LANDTVLLTFADSVSELELKTNEALDMLSKWALNNKLKFKIYSFKNQLLSSLKILIIINPKYYSMARL
jgi:hypothetical protein